MGDGQFIPNLLVLAKSSAGLAAAQTAAAKKLLDQAHEAYPHDGCAITLSVLLQDAGIAVEDTYRAIDLGNVLKKRGWQVVAIGEQKEGDVGSTCGSTPNHGHDHIYLVVMRVNPDEMLIVDNQDSAPHFRFASGKGKTPTRFFLRAQA